MVLSRKQTLLLIVLPMASTFLCLRLYLHLIGVRHVYPGGILVHHLFWGILIELPAAFVLVLGTNNQRVEALATAALGVGSAMILDEVTYLVATKATDADYTSSPSLYGAIVLVSLAVIFLLVLYRLNRDSTKD